MLMRSRASYFAVYSRRHPGKHTKGLYVSAAQLVNLGELINE